MPSLGTLPDELIHQILRHIPPEQTLASIALVSRRFNSLTEERLLWRYYCSTSFRYWQPNHCFWDRIRGNLHDVDWKALFLLRLKRNSHIATLLDSIIASRVSRHEKTEQLCRYGYDAKDYLLTQSRVDDSVPDAMARSYYSCAVLNSIHRSLAIEEWAKYQQHFARRFAQSISNAERLNAGMKLERALGAFDMFLLHDNEGDLDETSELLDDIASRFRAANPGFDRATTRVKALVSAQWLHTNYMPRLHDTTDHKMQYLRHCLIGRALRDDQYASLPIVCAAIYCALASRLGFEAYPCALPNQAHAIVLSSRGLSLNGAHLPPEHADHQESMFLDPYVSADEVSVEHIKSLLHGLGIYNGHHNLLVPTPTDQLVIRTAHNVSSSFTSFRTFNRPFSQLIPLVELNRGDWARNIQPALYSVNWANIMMAPIQPDNDDLRWSLERSVRQLLTCTYEYFPEDAWLIEKYICPMYDAFMSPSRPQAGLELPSHQIRERIKALRRADASIRTPRRRSDLANGIRVKYRVGQVFRHKRYDYHGIILGWSTHGAGAMLRWDRHAPLFDREHTQPYYRCLVGIDGSDQYIIAEHSIEAINLRGGLEVLPTDIKELVSLAGKFFKRWDGERGVFVSNLGEYFPED
ncbi:hypothetical protein GGS21DRAFT_112681 [Xylaria nigripes]|nr:hypothetical protein GGS21DRAFT_112681 [Xylaria nigripes]